MSLKSVYHVLRSCGVDLKKENFFLCLSGKKCYNIFLYSSVVFASSAPDNKRMIIYYLHAINMIFMGTNFSPLVYPYFTPIYFPQLKKSMIVVNEFVLTMQVPSWKIYDFA